MYGVENRFKMQLLLGLKGSPLVGVRIVNFVPPEFIFRYVPCDVDVKMESGGP